MAMKNSNDITWNRTCDLPACNKIPNPTLQQRAPHLRWGFAKMTQLFWAFLCRLAALLKIEEEI